MRERLSDAEVCRRNVWGPGTILIGSDQIRGRISIRITAVGESAILARRKGCAEYATWDLADWKDLQADDDGDIAALEGIISA